MKVVITEIEGVEAVVGPFLDESRALDWAYGHCDKSIRVRPVLDPDEFKLVKPKERKTLLERVRDVVRGSPLPVG